MLKSTVQPGSAGFLLTLLLLLAGTSAHLASQSQGIGTIKGKIQMPPLGTPLNQQRPARYGGYSSGERSAASVKEQAPEVTNVVVYLEGPGLENVQRDARKAVLDQRNAAFIPHVLPIAKGTTVEIVNRDKTYHNVFSLSNTKKFNIGRRPTGEEAPVTFDKSGPVQVFCDIHSHMTAYILVLENPVFVQPKADGTFSLEGVPPGKYVIHVWHERFSASSQNITVNSGETATIDFTLQ